MTLKEELEGCLLVLIHLEDDTFDETKGFTSFSEHPPFINMRSYLKVYDHDMISFTNYLNYKYIGEERLWKNSAREFFATTKSRTFYKTIVRNHKLELCLS
jgi:hypothetical protein